MNNVDINNLQKSIVDEIYRHINGGTKCNHDYERAEDGTSDLICKKCNQRAKQAYARYNY